jgi:hypothetical protein
LCPIGGAATAAQASRSEPKASEAQWDRLATPMSTASLLRWIALVAGAELAARGYLADSIALCHAGAALVALALAALLRQTRARRPGIALGGALLALTAVDAVWALRAESDRVSEAAPTRIGPFDCERPVVFVAADSPAALGSDLAGRLVLVGTPALPEIAPRASPLGRALEAWLRARDADVSLVIDRTREVVLAARRAGADVALLIGRDPRVLARGLRSLAGSYAIRAIEPGGDLEALLAERGCR